MVLIRKHLVSDTLAAKRTYGRGNTKKYITVHETDNTRKGADANAHARLQASGNSRQASWHWQVDDKEAVQSFEHTWMCWAGGSRKGNKEAIHVEICVNSDGDYIQAVKNAADLIKKIMADEHIPIDQVVQHNYWSGKNCPKVIRGGSKISWDEFKEILISSPMEKEERKEGVRMYKPSNQEFVKATERVLKQMEVRALYEDKAISSSHREKLMKGELSLDDAVALLFIGLDRGMFK